MIKNRKIPKIELEMTLVFQHLYDDNFGVIANARTYGPAELVMIMPSRFIPRLGESYVCAISSTRGVFVHNGKRYPLYIASRKDKGSFLDEVDYIVTQEITKGEFKNNPFNKLKSLKIGR